LTGTGSNTPGSNAPGSNTTGSGAPITAILAFGEAVGAPEVAFELRRAGWQVVVLHRRGSNCALRRVRALASHDITAPETDAPRALAEAAALLRRHPGAALIAADDMALRLVEALAPTIAETAILALPTGPGLIALGLDKDRQLAAAAAAGFAVPETWPATAADRIPTDAYPLILKPRRAVLAAGDRWHKGEVTRIATPAALHAAMAAAMAAQNAPNAPWDPADYHLQRAIAGTGQGICGAVIAGHPTLLYGHTRIRMANPAGSGASACQARPLDTEEITAARRLMTLTDPTAQGPFMLELLRPADGPPVFLESMPASGAPTRAPTRCPAGSASASSPRCSPDSPSPPMTLACCRCASRPRRTACCARRFMAGSTAAHAAARRRSACSACWPAWPAAPGGTTRPPATGMTPRIPGIPGPSSPSACATRPPADDPARHSPARPASGAPHHPARPQHLLA
jgi:hypothetical protein